MAVQNAENGVAREHSRPAFDTAHTTSYSTSIETMCLSFTVFEIQPVICQKLPILIHLTCIGARRSLAPENWSP